MSWSRKEGVEVAERQGYGLTEDEIALFGHLRGFWEGFNALPQLHPADADEVAFHIHALSRVVGMRAAHRAHPDVVPNRSGTPILSASRPDV